MLADVAITLNTAAIGGNFSARDQLLKSPEVADEKM
jgi:hypothetical protein